MKILLCPYCVEPHSADCDDPRSWRSDPSRRYGAPCRSCGVWQEAGKPHRVCDVCLGAGMLMGAMA